MMRGAGILGAGAAVGFGPAAVFARPAPKPFDGTPLADNRVARTFQALDMPLPAIRVIGANGSVDLSRLTGKTRIVTLWAEWCAPCLAEARDFADLRKRYAGPSFDIVSILTMGNAKLDYAGALARLQKAKAGGLPLLIEPNDGKQVGAALTENNDLPCTLVVDAKGRVHARTSGARFVTPAPPTGIVRDPRAPAAPSRKMALTEAQKRQLLSGDRQSLWGTPAAAAFVVGLRDGVLR